ncbi:MAG: ligand-binding sensor domain-containing protein [Chitinophagaceae bacterium]
MILISTCLHAQNNYVFQHFTTEDGLSSDQKINVFQDAEGFYWFNSLSGIQRYDGRNFVAYKYENKSSKDILDTWAGKPVEDKQKNIWLINKEGINILYRNKQQLRRFYLPDAVDSTTNNVSAVVKDENNKIWIFTTKNIFWYDDISQKPVLFKRIISNDDSIAKVTYNAGTNSFLILASAKYNTVTVLNITTKKSSFLIENVDELLGHLNPVSLFQTDNNSNLWMGNFVGDFCRYNLITGQVEHYYILHQKDKNKKPLPSAALYDCLDDGMGTVWFAGDNYAGLLYYNKKADSFFAIQNNNSLEYGLHYDEDIYNLFKDNEGNIWVNTDLGVNVFNTRIQFFKYVQANNGQQFSTDITSVFESSNNHIWVSTWGDGIFEYDSNFVLLKNYRHDNNDAASLGDTLNRTWCITEDAKGRMWIGCQYAMLSVLNTATGKFINKKIKSFDDKTILHSATDKQNNIWFSLHNGAIAKWDAVKDTIITYKNLYKNRPLSIIDGFCIDNDNNIWAATRENGLNRFNTTSNMMDENALLQYHVFFPAILNDSMIIGGTAGNGFFIFNKHNKKTRFYTTKNGLSSNIVFCAMPDNNENIWILASDGIERLDIKTGKIFQFDINDGIHDHIFSRTICKLKNGNIVIAGNSGIIYFNPADINTKPAPPNVTITGFNADQHSFAIDSLLKLNKIHLSHNQNAINIEFASLSFNGRKSNTYFYKLEGTDKDWISSGTNRSVTYANLSPGNYIFKVKSQNSDGIETKNITTLSIIIYPPWWQTWWAYLLWFLITTLIIYAVYDYRKRSRAKLSSVRQKIAADLHDDIGSTLNSISVYSEVANQQIETNTKNAKNLLHKMGDASRNMIDTMNDIVWAINPKNDQFENILQRMQYFAGELLSGKNILLQFNADENIKNIKLPMEKRKNFYLIFKEAINNSYKYSSAKMVNVSIAETSNKLVMIITDDGIGFELSDKISGGNGLKNMQNRAKEIGAQLNVTSWLKKGTRIELLMPV